MAITYVDSTQVFSSANTTVVTIPAATQVGDLMILQAVGGWTPSVPSGWTQEYAYAGSNIGSFVAYKTATLADIGATVTVSWSSSYNNVANLIVINGGSGLRTPASHLWSSTGGTGTPASQSAAAGDMVVYLGGNRSDGGAPSLSRGTVDKTGKDASNIAAGVIGHELLATDTMVSCTFTAPSNGSGYEYSALLISGGGTPPTSGIMSRQSVIALTSDGAPNAQMSRQSLFALTSDQPPNAIVSRLSIQVLTPTAPRFRGWGVKLQ